jgi:hypothetical protein
MCNGFSGFLHKNGQVFFIEPNDNGDISHHDVLARMPGGLKKDADLVAFEFPEWTIKSFRWDVNDVPSWATKNKCVGVFKKVKPIWAEYEKVRDAAYAEYEKVRAAASAEYKKVRDAAYAEYKKVRDAAYAEYKKVRDAAYAEYEKVRDAAYAEYKKVRDAALAEYEKVRAAASAEMIEKLSTINGYLK